MKKLMIMLGAVAIAAFAQAATVGWNIGSEYIALDTDCSIPLPSAKVYIFDALTTDMTTLASKLAGGDRTVVTGYMKDTVGDAEFGGFSMSANMDTPQGVTWANDYAHAQLLILDTDKLDTATQFWVSDDLSFKVTDGIKGGSQGLFQFDGMAVDGWTTISNVPEPTSGLLLLLGVAGLALRRRRA